MTTRSPQPDTALVSAARYYISDGERTLELRHVESHSVDDGNGGQIVIGADGRPMGKTESGGGYTINLKCRSSQRRREVAWRRLEKTKVNFRFDIQTSRTYREQYIDCWVTKVNESASNGEYTLDVTILAVDVEPIDL